MKKVIEYVEKVKIKHRVIVDISDNFDVEELLDTIVEDTNDKYTDIDDVHDYLSKVDGLNIVQVDANCEVDNQSCIEYDDDYDYEEDM